MSLYRWCGQMRDTVPLNCRWRMMALNSLNSCCFTDHRHDVSNYGKYHLFMAVATPTVHATPLILKLRFLHIRKCI